MFNNYNLGGNDPESVNAAADGAVTWFGTDPERVLIDQAAAALKAD